MKILFVVGRYLPGWKAGGTIRAFANLVSRLSHDHDVHVITRDRDLGDPMPYAGVTRNAWQDVGPAKVIYLSPRKWQMTRIPRMVSEVKPDVTYYGSMFDWEFGVAPLVGRWSNRRPDIPAIVAPHGVLGRGALAIKSRKKAMYLAMATRRGLFDGVVWHATCAGEERDIHRAFGSEANVVVAPNLCEVSAGANQDRPDKIKGSARLVFLSRIAPIKNLHTAIQIAGRSEAPVSLDIWGPIEDKDYWRDCQKRIEQLPEQITVTYCGAAAPDKVEEILSRYDALLLPTRNENFGHVIAESLLAGCPVIISDQTPWRELQQLGVGWDIPLSDGEAFVQAVATIGAMDEPAHAAMRRRTADFGRQRANDPANMDSYARLLRTAVDSTDRTRQRKTAA